MTDERESRIGLNISIINRAARAYFYHRLKDFDIGPGQQAYLLSLLPGETIVQEELAKRLKIDKANVTRALKGLEKSGYISKKRSWKDQRAWEISLTETGMEIRRDIESIAKGWIDALRKPLSPEDWEHLEGSLDAIAESLDKFPQVYEDGETF